MPTVEYKKRKQDYTVRYHRENCKVISIQLSNKYDKDILEILSHQKNKSNFIKELIRASSSGSKHGDVS